MWYSISDHQLILSTTLTRAVLDLKHPAMKLLTDNGTANTVHDYHFDSSRHCAMSKSTKSRSMGQATFQAFQILRPKPGETHETLHLPSAKCSHLRDQAGSQVR